MYCTFCGNKNSDGNRYCGMCGREMTASTSSPKPPPTVSLVPPGAQGPHDPLPASWHSPWLALLLSAVLPGAGQAYNGQPIKGFFLFFLSVLVIPYFINLYDAFSSAVRLKRAGESSGCSGFVWVGLQVWLALNTALLVMLGLTIAGVLS